MKLVIKISFYYDACLEKITLSVSQRASNHFYNKTLDYENNCNSHELLPISTLCPGTSYSEIYLS
jgi:hypothetical protein